MSHLTTDHRMVQNPALGAFLQWRLSAGYCGSASGRGVPLTQIFLLLPLVFHEPTYTLLGKTTRPSGLRRFASKFSSPTTSQSDLLLDLQERTDAMKPISLQSLRLAIRYQLVTVDRSSATVLPLSRSQPRAGVPSSVKAMGRNSEKVGAWFSDLTEFEVASVLKVRF